MSLNRSNFPYIITLKLPSENSLELLINFPLKSIAPWLPQNAQGEGEGGEKGMQGNVR